jgi:HSP20 family protein
MNFLIPNTRSQWFYDIDRFFEPFEAEKNISLASEIEDADDHILMSFDVPGMKEDDFSVKVEDNQLLIAGEKKREETKSEKRNLIYSRRSYGKFQKMYTLPETVDAKKIEADYRDGVLRVYLPKTVVQKENAIEVKVKAKDTFFDRLLGSSHKE